MQILIQQVWEGDGRSAKVMSPQVTLLLLSLLLIHDRAWSSRVWRSLWC